MASIENERDDPDPCLLDHLSPPTSPSLLSAATASLNSDLAACIRPANETNPFAGPSSLTPDVAPTQPTLSRRELKRKLTKEKGKQRSHDIRKKSRIANPTIQEHGKKKFLDSAVPFFTNAQVERAAVASTGYVGFGGRKKKKVGKGGQVEDGAAVLHEDIRTEVADGGAVDYTQADAMLKGLLSEKGYNLLLWDGL